MKRIGLIDVDGHNFPNLPLMKLSAWHKSIGDKVQWYEPMLSGHQDIVYMSKVFTFTPDYQYPVDADSVVKGGTGYIYPGGGESLPYEIEHIYPDYSIYYDRMPWVKDTAYGFLTRGCPRDCDFCIVGEKEGRHSQKSPIWMSSGEGRRTSCCLTPTSLPARSGDSCQNS